MTLLDAYVAGWALVDDAPMPTQRNIADLVACETVAEALDAGEKAARRATLERKRLRLYHTHSKEVKAAAAALLLAHVPMAHLTTVLVLMGTNTATKRQRADQAQTVLHAAMFASPLALRKWQEANQQAWAVAANFGRAEARASTEPGPADPTLVGRYAKEEPTYRPELAPDWTSQQLGRLAWHLSNDDLTDHEDPEAYIRRRIEDGDAIGETTEDLMHEALSRAFVDWFNTGSGEDLGQFFWVTEEDDRVCPICDSLEEESPYPADEAPQPPEHPDCRCHLERG